MDLVAPQVHVRVRVEDPRARTNDGLRVVRGPRETDTRREVVLVRVDEPGRIAVLPADEGHRRAVAEIEVGQNLADVVQRRLQRYRNPRQRERPCYAPVVLKNASYSSAASSSTAARLALRPRRSPGQTLAYRIPVPSARDVRLGWRRELEYPGLEEPSGPRLPSCVSTEPPGMRPQLQVSRSSI